MPKQPISIGGFTLAVSIDQLTWVAPGGVHISHPQRAQRVAEHYAALYRRSGGAA